MLLAICACEFVKKFIYRKLPNWLQINRVENIVHARLQDNAKLADVTTTIWVERHTT